MFTPILNLIVNQPACSGPNCIGYSTVMSVPGFESLGLRTGGAEVGADRGAPQAGGQYPVRARPTEVTRLDPSR